MPGSLSECVPPCFSTTIWFTFAQLRSLTPGSCRVQTQSAAGEPQRSSWRRRRPRSVPHPESRVPWQPGGGLTRRPTTPAGYRCERSSSWWRTPGTRLDVQTDNKETEDKIINSRVHFFVLHKTARNILLFLKKGCKCFRAKRRKQIVKLMQSIVFTINCSVI